MKALFSLAVVLAVAAPSLRADAPPLRDASHESVRNEVETAIGKGLAWLKAQQQPDGSFRNPLVPAAAPEHPALTALP
ncbi:MAG TPA: hypothetical protein VEO95_01195, partial [Chthoniobacteraceae bacterium]|nr:hypothetical protein [Chthoniobacteraceae bacterium]